MAVAGDAHLPHKRPLYRLVTTTNNNTMWSYSVWHLRTKRGMEVRSNQRCQRCTWGEVSGGGVSPHIKSYLNKRWQILWITSTSYFTLNRFSHDKQLFLKLPSFPLSHHQKAFHAYISERSTSPLEGIVWHFGKYTYSPKCQTLPVNASFKADTFPTPSI